MDGHQVVFKRPPDQFGPRVSEGFVAVPVPGTGTSRVQNTSAPGHLSLVELQCGEAGPRPPGTAVLAQSSLQSGTSSLFDGRTGAEHHRAALGTAGFLDPPRFSLLNNLFCEIN